MRNIGKRINKLVQIISSMSDVTRRFCSLGVYNTFDKRMNEDSAVVRPTKPRVDEFVFSLPNTRYNNYPSSTTS